MDRIAILLVLYKDVDDLKNLIHSIEIQTMKEFEIFAIDCDIEQKSIAYLKTINNIPIHFYSYRGNLGYAAGNNYLAQQAISLGFEYLLICNTDVILDKDTLLKLFDEIHGSDYAFSSPCILSGTPNSNKKIYAYAPFMNFKKLIVEYPYSDYSLIHTYPSKIEINYTSGCLFLIKSREFLACGLFNTDGFMYGEETNLACRMRKSRYIGIALKGAIAWHNHNTSQKSLDLLIKSYYYMNRNFISLCKYNSSYNIIYKTLLLELLYCPYKIYIYTKRYGLKYLFYYYKAYLDGLLNKKNEHKFHLL